MNTTHFHLYIHDLLILPWLVLYCIVLKGWSLLPNAVRPFSDLLWSPEFRYWGSLPSLKSQTPDPQLKVLPGGLVLRIFTSWENPSTLALFEPANLGSRVEHVISRPPSRHTLVLLNMMEKDYHPLWEDNQDCLYLGPYILLTCILLQLVYNFNSWNLKNTFSQSIIKFTFFLLTTKKRILKSFPSSLKLLRQNKKKWRINPGRLCCLNP